MYGLLVVVAIVAASNADPIERLESKPLAGRIYGGEYVRIESQPHQVSVERSGRHVCGGSIISSRYVLTAAHCVVGAVYPELRVRAGSSVLEAQGSVHQVIGAVVHEQYGANPRGVAVNDIALLWLGQELRFDATRRPIRMYEPGERLVPWEVGTLSGWGQHQAGPTAYQLKALDVSVFSYDTCNQAYRPFYGDIPAGQVCAGRYGQNGLGACSGDDGGPLVVRGRLAGIVSWGKGCAQANFPSVLTEIAYHRYWIRQNSGV